jgi:hypothetical protein
MTVETKKILDKTPEGDFVLTEQGEFLSYLDAHLKLFENYLTTKKLSAEEHKEILSKIQVHMQESIQGMDDFLEHMGTVAAFLHTDEKALTDYLTKHILEVLTDSQTKIKNQELDRLESSESFSSITEEILFKVGAIFPKSSHFVFKEDLLVIQNTTNGQIIKPVGLLVEVKEDQARAQKEKESLEQAQKEKLAQIELEKKSRPVSNPKEEPQQSSQPLPEVKEELSILLEILELSLNFSGKKLELTEHREEVEDSSISQEELHSQSESTPTFTPEIEDEDSVTQEESPIHPSEATFDTEWEKEPTLDEVYATEDSEISIPEITDDLHFEESPISEEDFSLDPEEPQIEETIVPVIEESDSEIIPEIDIEEEVLPPSKIQPTQKPRKQSHASQKFHSVNPAPFSSFNYLAYLQLTRSIEKLKEDREKYQDWLSKASPLIKTFLSIQANLSKEANGTVLDWGEYYQTVSQKSGVDLKTVRDFKKTLEKLNLTKKFLEISVKELKKEPESVTKLLKTGWPHFVDAFGEAPVYDRVEEKLAVLYSKIKEESHRAPIEKILTKAIQKLRTL